MRKKKKVLFFLPGGVGGAERMTITVGKLLPREQYDVKFIVVGILKNIYDFIPNDYCCDCIPVKNIWCASTLRILIKILQEKPDLVYVSQAAYNARVIIASRLARVKVIARSSGMVSTYSKFWFWQVKQTYKYATMLIAQQEEMRQEMHKLLNIPLSKIVTLHNPIDIESIKQKASEASPYPKGQINFVNVSRINNAKAQDIAINAFEKVIQQIENAHLYFIGTYSEDDPYYKFLKQLIYDKNLDNNVHFIGYDNNPYKWIEHCNVFIFPSRREGLPNALIEASYLGVSCVAAKCLPIIESIIKNGKNGYTVEVEDVAGLANAMINSLDIRDTTMLYHPSDKSDFIKLFDEVLYS